MNYLDELNPQQRAAVETINGPMMIVAGAGSGKTRVITYRIAHLINSGVDPFNILALTFTNKASKEMRERISKIVGPQAKNIWSGTFHSVFARILRQEADKIGFPANFTIYDKDDAKSLLKSIIKEQNLDEKAYNVNHVMHRISSAKNNLISAKEYNENEQIQADDFSMGKGKLDTFIRFIKVVVSVQVLWISTICYLKPMCLFVSTPMYFINTNINLNM